MNPRLVREWIGIFRDLAMACTAIFMVIWETVVVLTPNVLIVGAGLTLLGLPVAIRLDQLFRPPPPPPNGHDDPFDGPGGYYRDG